MKRYGISILLMMICLGCGDDTQKEDTPLDTNFASSKSLIVGRVTTRLDTGKMILYRFNKQEGVRYRIDVKSLYGDFDVYGHWNKRFDPWDRAEKSYRPGNQLDSITIEATKDGPYYFLLHAYAGGEAKITLDAERFANPSPKPKSTSFECKVCDDHNQCQDYIDEIVEAIPEFSSYNRSVDFISDNGGSYCQSISSGIRCPKRWFGKSYMTNKLLFHELTHQLRVRKLYNAGGSSGICGSGSCSSSEFQASLLESFYFPQSCGGGNYKFTDINGVKRYPSDILSTLRESPAISEEELWDFASGRKDSLKPYLDRFNVKNTSDLYWSQTYR